MRVFAAYALLAFVLAGCARVDSEVPLKDEDGRYVIHLTSANQFEPADARVPIGATVVWIVDDGFHDVNADDGSFSSNTGRPMDELGHPSLMGPGESFSHTFTEKGKWGYWCHTHHEFDMHGVIRVG